MVQDVGALVQSLKEVKDMMNDLAVLVQQQSEVLGRIDINVEAAKTHVKKGNQQVEKAIEYQRKARYDMRQEYDCGVRFTSSFVRVFTLQKAHVLSSYHCGHYYPACYFDRDPYA